MGMDFIRSRRQQHTKAWSRQFMSRTVDLFAGAGGSTKQVFRAANAAGHELRIGDEVLIRQSPDGTVVVSKDIAQVASVAKPVHDLLHALDVSDGVMCGRVYQSFAGVGFTDIEYEV